MDRAEYTRRLEFEHELISRRIGWLLTSQTILLTAYGFVISNPNPGAEGHTNSSHSAGSGRLVWRSRSLSCQAPYLARLQG